MYEVKSNGVTLLLANTFAQAKRRFDSCNVSAEIWQYKDNGKALMFEKTTRYPMYAEVV